MTDKDCQDFLDQLDKVEGLPLRGPQLGEEIKKRLPLPADRDRLLEQDYATEG